jgi:hypothetical protein
LQKLLGYLADHSLGDPPQPVKEYQIATEVLGRGQQFDPRVDSSVRVNVARLRSRLLEYYATEGKNDPLRIEIPKGAYVIRFQERVEPNPGEHSETGAIAIESGEPREAAGQAAHKRRPLGALAAAAAVGMALGALLTVWTTTGSIRRGGPPAVLQGFWSEFTAPREKTIIVFSNARFVGDGENGLRYFNPAEDRLEDIRELHTGVGEVVGVYELSRLFQSLGAPLEVKRSALVDWDEVKKANVIFIGGPAENMPVRELQSARFVFEPRVDADGQRRVVVASRSGDGQLQLFDAGATRPARRDYAVIRLLPGLVPGRRIIILAGITTLGTQAAVEFVCRPDTVQALLSKLAQEGFEGPTPGFECVLEVSINGGVPVESKIVAFEQLSDGSPVLSRVE